MDDDTVILDLSECDSDATLDLSESDSNATRYCLTSPLIHPNESKSSVHMSPPASPQLRRSSRLNKK